MIPCERRPIRAGDAQRCRTEVMPNFLERRQNEVRRISLPRTRVNNREAGPGLLHSHPRCLSASGATSATAAAQLAHLFFESLHPFCQPVEALVDLLPVPLFVLAPASPGTSLVRASSCPPLLLHVPRRRDAPRRLCRPC